MQQAEAVEERINSTDSDIPSTSMDVVEQLPASCESVGVDTQSEIDISPSRRRSLEDAPTSVSKRSRNNSQLVLDVLEKSTAERQKLLKNMMSAADQDSDPTSLFFKSIAMTVKTFPPQLIAEAKASVFTIINALELRALRVRDNGASDIP